MQDAAYHRRMTEPAKPVSIQAATVILAREGPGGVPEYLLVQRGEQLAFAGGALVFPGGRVDAADRQMVPGVPLDPRAEAKLMRETRRPSALKARALALAAVRETFEETGLLLGTKGNAPPRAPAGPWQAFAEAKIHPDLSTMHFIARAITPPRRVRRYDTRFFTMDASAIANKIEGKVGPDSELVELVWLPRPEIKQRIQLMVITEIVLRDLMAQIDAGFSHDLPVPYYHVVRGKRVRDLL